MKTVLITGGLGFIGSYIADSLLRIGHKVIIFDMSFQLPRNLIWKECSNSACFEKGKLVNINGDIRNKALLEHTLRMYGPDTVIHLAAMSDAAMAQKFPAECWEINVSGFHNLLMSLKTISCVEKICFASSSYVYGDFAYDPADELHPLRPNHIYGITKLEGEKILQRICKKDNIKYTIIRPTSVYGEGSNPQRVCLKMVHDALIKKEIIVYDGGIIRLDFTHISDLVNGFLKVLDNGKSNDQIFNISRGEARSLGELAGIIKGYIPEVKITTKTIDSKRPKRGSLDISKAMVLLGYEPKVSLEEGIADLITKLSNKINSDDTFIPSIH